MRLRQRLTALETKDGAHSAHVVLWGAGQSFAEALASSPQHAATAPRLLIKLSFAGGDPLTPD